MADIFERLAQKRTAYKKLPWVVRGLLVIVAFVLGILGVIAMFTPLAVLEIGSLLVFSSLTILSFEFNWAYSLLAWIRQKLQHKRFRRNMLLFAGVIIAMYTAILATSLIG